MDKSHPIILIFGLMFALESYLTSLRSASAAAILWHRNRFDKVLAKLINPHDEQGKEKSKQNIPIDEKSPFVERPMTHLSSNRMLEDIETLTDLKMELPEISICSILN